MQFWYCWGAVFILRWSFYWSGEKLRFHCMYLCYCNSAVKPWGGYIMYILLFRFSATWWSRWLYWSGACKPREAAVVWQQQQHRTWTGVWKRSHWSRDGSGALWWNAQQRGFGHRAGWVSMILLEGWDGFCKLMLDYDDIQIYIMWSSNVSPI